MDKKEASSLCAPPTAAVSVPNVAKVCDAPAGPAPARLPTLSVNKRPFALVLSSPRKSTTKMTHAIFGARLLTSTADVLFFTSDSDDGRPGVVPSPDNEWWYGRRNSGHSVG